MTLLKQLALMNYPRKDINLKHNIIRALDSELLLQTVFGWVNETRQAEGETVIVLDGKTLDVAWSEDINNTPCRQRILCWQRHCALSGKIGE